jgi:hypothetical protein
MKFVYNHTTLDTDNLDYDLLSNPEIVKAIQLQKLKNNQINNPLQVNKAVNDPDKNIKTKGRK